ncbi:MAG: hypothetical protein KDC87_15655 [Planctomycetes bacterium]|nr:hypothetical protein [Planctomycetota bacterium]MCB9872372.1 hypothetical protein [Planctomycetota bacterium]
MLIRKVTGLLRGKVSSTQVFVAGLLGTMLGFVPGFALPGDLGGGFSQSPGLILGLLFLVLVLNCNLALFGLSLMLAKLLSLAIMPVSFAIGRALLDGPTSGLFATMINAPVLAWFGLEYYATTGGLLLGAVLGMVWGFGLTRGLRAFRGAMAKVETREGYQRQMGKGWVRWLAWLLLGGQSKKSYQELLDAGRGLPIRIPGVILVAVLAAGIWLLQGWLGSAALRRGLVIGLERSNGATVDLGGLQLDLGAGRVTLDALAMADASALDKDLLRADKLELAIGTRSLLRRRVVIDNVTGSGIRSGAQRATAGERKYAEPAPQPPAPEGNDKTLDDYLKQAREWRDRLQQISRWIEKLFNRDKPGAESGEQRDRRIAEERKAYGLARVAATHLIQGAPMLLVRKVNLEGVKVEGRGLVDIRARNLSTQPSLVDEAMSVTVRAQDDLFGLDLALPKGASAVSGKAFCKGLAIDKMMAQLNTKFAALRGGTMDISLEGGVQQRVGAGAWIDLPLQIALRDTKLAVQGLQEAKLDALQLPLGLRGPLAAPRVSFDDKVLQKALLDAGKTELANQLRTRAEKLIGDKLSPQVKGALDKVREQVKDPNDALRQAEAAARKATEEAKKKAADEAKKRAAQGLEKLFGGKKKAP